MADFSKNRAMALYNILQQYTDENHQLSMQEILTFMENSGHSCSEDSILRYMKQLRTEMGVDIISGRGRNSRYYIGSRLLEKEELKLLIDSINASNFIEKSVATKMIDKLKGTTSIYEGAELDRTVLGITVAKTENRKILYNVNLIQEALNKKVQINFDSLRWNEKKELVKSNSHRQRMYPWALLWANDRYYLYGYDIVEKDGIYRERHYRVDKLANIELTDIPRRGEKQFHSFHADTYVARRMGMFAGEEHLITVKAPESLVGAFIDQYGKRIMITGGEAGTVIIKFTAVPSPILLGWLASLRDKDGRNVEVVEPESVRRDMIQMLKNNMACYEM